MYLTVKEELQYVITYIILTLIDYMSKQNILNNAELSNGKTTYHMCNSILPLTVLFQEARHVRIGDYVMGDILITDNFTTFPMVIIGLLFIDVIPN